ncbi:MAG TPA: ABC transporter ATP-binding protein [Alloiococcus sp.]|nr:ABC transporter ATP-binding protein [Alloiococcus sp.]
MITMKDVTKTYQMGEEVVTALDNVSLTVEEGEFTSIMGPSGSGKSTIMNILGLLDKFDSGSYTLNGINVSDHDDEELAKIRNKEIGFVFQSFNLLPRMNLLENVMLPLVYAKVPKKERQRRAKEALERVGLGNRLYHKTNEISGGQTQRVAIARAIVNNPSVLMADEPTGNLDSKTTKTIMRIFQELNDEGTTIIMVTHEPEMAQYTKRIVHVRDGKIEKTEKITPKSLKEEADDA